MARNFEARIVLERRIIEMSLKWLVSLWGRKAFIDVKNTERAVRERAERESGTSCWEELCRASKKNTERTPHVSIEQIFAIEAWVNLRELSGGLYRKFPL
jgi:hypothetical protein